jgi:hypothetical protein
MLPMAGLPVHFFIIFVRTNILEGRYLGGLIAFREMFPEASNGDGIVRLSYMSLEDLESDLERVETLGLLRGRDLAIGDMRQGELLLCPAIKFVDAGSEFMPSWRAYPAAGEALQSSAT